jgi:hypothetical protein
MYSDPAETTAMSAAGRDAVGRKHQALRTELIASNCWAGLGWPTRRIPGP